MRLEVVVEENESGEFQAKAVEYPGVSATGRTEKEALVRLLDALEVHLKQAGKEASRG
jgi:predicted RNase H-like HicB family nuclease